MTNEEFSTSQAARAVGLEPKYVASWIDRSVFELGTIDHTSSGHGRPRRWTRRTVHRLALMAALSKIGFTNGAAKAAADSCMARVDRMSSLERAFLIIRCDGEADVYLHKRPVSFEDVFDTLASGSGVAFVLDLRQIFTITDAALAALKD